MNASNADTYILFDVAGSTYAVHSRDVQQMEMIGHITPLPNAPSSIEGVVFTRGQVIPALNLRARFGFEKTAHTSRTRLIVTNNNGRVVGLIADSAREFMSIPGDAVQPPPDSMAALSGNYLKGIVTIEDRIILVIDLDDLLSVGQHRSAAFETQS